MKFIVQKYNKTEHWYECHKVCKTYPEAEQEEQELKKRGEKTYIDIRQNVRAADIKAAQSWFCPRRHRAHGSSQETALAQQSLICQNDPQSNKISIPYSS